MRSIDLCGYDREERAPKSGRCRHVPLTKRLRTALQTHRHMKGSWVLICEVKQNEKVSLGPWSPEVFKLQGARAYRLASLPAPARPWHSLRHTFCSHLTMRGAPTRAIQELAGHADIQTTMHYMHLSPAARAKQPLIFIALEIFILHPIVINLMMILTDSFSRKLRTSPELIFGKPTFPLRYFLRNAPPTLTKGAFI